MEHYSILTTAGAAFFAQAVIDGTAIVGADFQLAVGDGGGEQYEPTSEQTELRGEQWRGVINNIYHNPDDDSQIAIEGIVPATVGGWVIREWGVFSKSGVLIAVGGLSDIFKPLPPSSEVKQVVIQAILDIKNAAVLKLIVDGNVVTASKDYVDRIRKDLASNVMHVIPVDDVHIKNAVAVSFRRFLTVKDGSVNATQALIDALTSGYTVEIPHDYILRIEAANLPGIGNVRLVGQYGSRPTILIDHTNTTSPQFNCGGKDLFANLQFRYPNQKRILATGETPVKYKPLFYGSGFFSEFRNMDIGNAYYAFMLGDQAYSASKITIDNIIGSPIYRGLSLERVLDIPRVSDINFNYNYLAGSEYEYDTTLKQWMHDNGEAFHIGRCDFGTFFRLFSYGYFRGIYLRSERYTGSADNCRFLSCDMDMTVHPFFAQNWQNRVSIMDSKLVGSSKISSYGLTDKEPSFNVIYASNGGVAVLDNLDVNNYTSNAIMTSANTVINNSTIHAYGTDNAQRAGILVISDAYLTIDNTVIDGSSGTQTRGVYTEVSTKTVTLGDGVDISGQSLESFRWMSGPNHFSRNATLGGTAGRNNISFITNIPKNYPCEEMPSNGNYFKISDYAEMTKPVITQYVNQPNHVVKGWIRLTNANAAGTNHVLGIDWVEDRNYFGGV